MNPCRSHVSPDGTEVWIGFPNLNRLIYVKHRDAAGKTVDLVK